MSILTKREKDYNKWYNELVIKADLAENSEIRGCMIIKPYGYAIWEKMQQQLDKMFKDSGHQNAYFPLFIPKNYFEAEEQNAQGFSKECAVVTHYRLKLDENNKKKLIISPEAKLQEELVIRPTSEAIIWKTYRNWIQSYRDLPILINQWANAIRWEMRTRLFLRTTEFLWQEGHTAHQSKEEAIQETMKMLDIYANFAENFMGISVVKGKKTISERFAGAQDTYCIEALMQDGKALQIGTSHFLGQNFSKAFNVKFTSQEGKQEYVWATSWGVSTRLIGALIMSHSDDNGSVIPPNLAPLQVVIIPIYKNEQELIQIQKIINPIMKELISNGISVKFDDRNQYKPGWKFNEYELKGVPIRITIGPKELKNQTVEFFRRDTLIKSIEKIDFVVLRVKELLIEIQKSIFNRSKRFKKSMITQVNSYQEFKMVLQEKGGFISAHWDGTFEEENQIKHETKATIRCIPLDNIIENGRSMISGKFSKQRVLFAKAY